ARARDRAPAERTPRARETPRARRARAAGGRARSKTPAGSPPARAARPSFLEERLEGGSKVGRGAAHRVHVRAQAEALFEPHSVELVELLLGQRQRGGAGGRGRAGRPPRPV